MKMFDKVVPMLNSFKYSLPSELEAAVSKQLNVFNEDNLVHRIWNKDSTVWTDSGEAKWLGWLTSVSAELQNIEEYKAFAKDAEHFEAIVLLGMGGSSLCPEVLAETFGNKNFFILDSTVPAQIKSLEEKLKIEKTLFIVASKSGSTLEPNTFKQYFFKKVSEKVGSEHAGRHFVAITDPGSKMQKVAENDNFRKIFLGNPEIGGRFSALSPFGMAAGASMGLDVEGILRNGQEMVKACEAKDSALNPGAVLGTILGICNKFGRDKLTIYTSPEIYDVGAWMEQLVAESTGKHGKSIIPIDLEPIGRPGDYSNDRIFVFLKLKNSAAGLQDEKFAALGNAGFPVIEITLETTANIGQEFFRWEFATAVAGAIMKINPFDQPDVESAKIETRKLTEEYEETGELPKETAFFQSEGISLFSSEEYAAKLGKSCADNPTLSQYLEAHLTNIVENDYFAILAYVDRSPENLELVQRIREKIFAKKHVATAVGFGPRFLHSTGQGYKGGANNGVFLQITSEDEVDFQVPQQAYSFGIVKSAQARGDFQVLLDRKRRALRVHLSKNVKNDLIRLLDLI